MILFYFFENVFKIQTLFQRPDRIVYTFRYHTYRIPHTGWCKTRHYNRHVLHIQARIRVSEFDVFEVTGTPHFKMQQHKQAIT